MKIPSLQGMKLVGGASGIDRIVRWVYVGEAMTNIDDTVNWLVGNELVIITGSSFLGDIQKLISLFPKFDAKNVAGIVINIGQYIPGIPPEIIKLADELQLPLFELPWEMRLVTVTRDIGSAIITKELDESAMDNLLENILFGDIALQKNHTHLLTRFGFENDDHFFVGILETEDFSTNNSQEKSQLPNNNLNIKNCLLSVTNDAFLNRNIQVITMLKGDSVIFLMKSNAFARQTLDGILDEVRQYVSLKFSGVKLYVGIGRSYSNDLFRMSYKQAEQALKTAKCEHFDNIICSYDDIGVYSILMNINNRQILEEYYHDIFGQLIEYDKGNKSNLLKTLEIFLVNGCQLSMTAKNLFVHENTLKYRLNKIEKLIGCDTRDFQQLIKLEIGFKIGRILYSEHSLL